MVPHKIHFEPDLKGNFHPTKVISCVKTIFFFSRLLSRLVWKASNIFLVSLVFRYLLKIPFFSFLVLLHIPWPKAMGLGFDKESEHHKYGDSVVALLYRLRALSIWPNILKLGQLVQISKNLEIPKLQILLSFSKVNQLTECSFKFWQESKMEQKFPVRNFQKFYEVFSQGFPILRKFGKMLFHHCKFPEIPLHGKRSTLNNSLMFPGFS